MYELPVSSWVLIAFSTLPWLFLSARHYVRGANDERSTRAPHDDG